jgi:hypothetical protein
VFHKRITNPLKVLKNKLKHVKITDAMSDLQLIGRAEKVAFPELGLFAVPARVDTGAKTSSIYASVKNNKGVLEVVFLSEDYEGYSSKVHRYRDFEKVIVASSNGTRQQRYKIKLLIEVGNRKIRARFTLADRSTQVYPVLIGRNVLAGKFIVDVKAGNPLTEKELKRSKELQAWKGKSK